MFNLENVNRMATALVETINIQHEGFLLIKVTVRRFHAFCQLLPDTKLM